MSSNELAYFMGLLATLLAMSIFILKVATEDYSPVERRARRFAILAGVAALALVVGSELAIYSFVSQVIGAFMAMPSVGLATIAVWHASRMTYRELGGGREKKISSPKAA